MSDPVLVYDNLSVSIAAGFNNAAPVIVDIPDDMWASWFDAGAVPAVHAPQAVGSIVSLTAPDSFGSGTHALVVVEPHGTIAGEYSLDGPPGSINTFTSFELTSQTAHVRIRSNFLSPGPTVFITGLTLSFVMGTGASASHPGRLAAAVESFFITESGVVTVGPLRPAFSTSRSFGRIIG